MSKLFSKFGNRSLVLVRFSNVEGEKGRANTEGDQRSFAIKFFMQDGIWDFTGNNTPVFFNKDVKILHDFIHSQKSDPKINLKSPAMMRKFWSLNPENLHQEKILLNGSLGSYGYRCMNVYESHTLLMIDKKDRRIWVKFHFKIQHGNKPLYGPQHLELKGKALKPVQKSND